MDDAVLSGTPSVGFRDRRLILALTVCFAIMATFWLGTRYPALDAQALAGGTAILEDPLGFEALLPVTSNDQFLNRVLRSTVNWIVTNRQGMTFGLSASYKY